MYFRTNALFSDSTATKSTNKNSVAITKKGYKTTDQIKILITGYAHSGTTFLQQFLGDVLFDQNDTFYLFEALHQKSFQYLASNYNLSSSLGSMHCQILSQFFNCEFEDSFDFNKLAWSALLTRFNKKLNNVSSKSLRDQCESAKYLIYKEIHFHFMKSYEFLYAKHPNLKIIALIRNPITHIPSAMRLPNPMCSITTLDRVKCNKTIAHFVYEICIMQLNGMHYAAKWNSFQFNVIKMEDMFNNITNKFNQTIRYFYHMFGGYRQLLIDDHMINQINAKYKTMKANSWQIGRSSPVKAYHPHQMKYIRGRCDTFAKYNGYNLQINLTIPHQTR